MLKIRNISHGTKIVLAGLLLAGIALLPACNQNTSPKAGVWAEVDGKPITKDQVERQYRGQAAAGSNAASQAQAVTFKLNILNELINNQILVEHASHAGISVAETEVDSKLKELQVAFTADEFQKKLREQGMDLDSLRQEIRENLIINKLINKEITSRIVVTDAEISDFY